MADGRVEPLLQWRETGIPLELSSEERMNQGYTYREVIKRRMHGDLLHTSLTERYRHSTAEQWREHIVAGRVLLDGVPGDLLSRLVSGQVLEWHRPPWEEPEAPLEAPVLYEDACIVVVHKPAGLPTMAGGGFLEHTLVHQLKMRLGTASPMHRLGRWTSGVVLCSRTREAGASIAAQFKERRVDKRYRALISGVPTWDERVIDTGIGPVPYAPLGTVYAASADGKASLSRVRVLERRADCTLCDVVIETGRPHQIRIHTASVGHPLLGDPLYQKGGLPGPDGTAVPGDPGYQLHAAEVAFDHPLTGNRLVIQARPPGVLATL